ncbi:OLC1v1008219C9 [Oldenlandia corymbosa var. corymbosa]|uniref:OLC1v1008219C9 n=1 Tax=Oldenlandia corymbosa var. corymbosa TaxID=529605 RepID=A0AAV1DNI5_OLDCO|nr:OLC1v1008219C9 [Oldenlandia corymbosa var. corymbosa]
MLPVCSATSTCAFHSQVSVHGGLTVSSYWAASGTACKMMDRLVPDFSSRAHHLGACMEKMPTKLFYSNSLEDSGHLGFIENKYSFQNEVDYHQLLLLTDGSQPNQTIERSLALGNEIPYVPSSTVSADEGQLVVYTNQFINDSDIPVELANSDSISTLNIIQDDPSLPSETLNIDSETVSSAKSSALDIAGGTSEFLSDLINKGENALNSSLDNVLSSAKSAFQEATEAVDSISDKLKVATDRTEEMAGSQLSSISTGFKEASSKLGVNAVEGLRRGIVIIEDSIAKGSTSAAYAYGSLKKLLPSEIQNTLDISENKIAEFSRPVGSAFLQGYSALQEFEKNLGLDPNDPIIPFLLLLGASATLWGWYWIFNYSGYTGDLSAKSTLELVTGNDDGVLIDIRTENLRERDGIPDLRRAARYRYASVALPEVDSNLRNLLNVGRNLEDLLIAGVIRNLKIVRENSKVIIMDGNGVHSKGVARALRKLGVKNSYLLQGGFQSWVKEGLRVKELRPETTLTILNEDAEAILEDLNPTPLRLLGFGVGVIAASYAALEWEKTLQFIGVLGLAQSIYRRVSSYENAEDFKQDASLLLAPVKLGGEAISWASGKLETGRNGLPTSPSSSDVQNRVLQAAAKHESQPSDGEQIEGQSPEPVASMNEKVDLSEA